MDRKYSYEQPKSVDFKREGDAAITRILNYSISKTTDEEMQSLWDAHREFVLSGDQSIEIPLEPEEWFKEQHRWQYYQLKFPMSVWSKDKIVEAIIRDKYSQDEMEAITNNMAAINAVFMQTLVEEGILAATKYLKDSINDANTARFKEMQEWRAMAKKVASEIFDK